MLGDVRDVVLIVAGIVWSLVFLVLLIVTLVVSFMANKYLGMAHEFLADRVPPALAELRGWAEAVHLQTASLPGSGATTPLERPSQHVDIRLPFFHRRRHWWQRLLPS